MGKLRKWAATIGFYGDDLEPDELTDLLGASPTVAVRRGDTWITSLGAEKIARTGSWRITSERCEHEDLDRQIATLLLRLSSDLTVWHDLTSRFRAVAFCGLWLDTYNDGVELSTKTLGLLAERSLLLDLDIYAADEVE